MITMSVSYLADGGWMFDHDHYRTHHIVAAQGGFLISSNKKMRPVVNRSYANFIPSPTESHFLQAPRHRGHRPERMDG